MKDWRVVMLSIEPYPAEHERYSFVIYRQEHNKEDLIRKVNLEYAGLFEVDEYALTEIQQ